MNSIDINDINQIYSQFSSEKIISSIKDENFEIAYLKSYIWLFPLCLTLGFIQFIPFLPEIEKIIFSILSIIFIITSFLLFLSQWCKLYFQDNYLIFQNKLGKKIIIDITKYPRIYIRQKSEIIGNDNYIDELKYFLYIEQNNANIELDLKKIKIEKIVSFLNSIEVCSSENISEEQWNKSINSKEKLFFEKISYLNNQKRIIGVKNHFQKIILSDFNYVIKLLISIFLIFISFGIDSFIKNVLKVPNTGIFYDLFLKISAFLFVLSFYFFIRLVDEGLNIYFKISYTSTGKIKINSHVLNYKENNVMINILAIQSPMSDDKYEYTLQVFENEKCYPISISSKHIKKINKIIDNLIFEPKNDKE